MAEGRGGLLSAGGIMSIIVGVFELLAGGLILALNWLSIPFLPPNIPSIPSIPGFLDSGGILKLASISSSLSITGIVFAILGILAIIGGISAIKRGSFGLSLVGAICALPSGALGILAVIFVSLAKGEFEESY